MREAKGPWYRRRYEWELTDGPDTEVVTFPAPEPDALERARERALAEAPPLSPPRPSVWRSWRPSPAPGRRRAKNRARSSS